MNVVTNLLALVVAEHGNIGQQKSAILAEVLGIKAVLVHEVEGEAAPEKRLVHTVGSLAHILARVRRDRPFVEELGALAQDNADVGDGAVAFEVGVMFGGPTEIVGADLLPAAVFAEACLGADEVVVGDHAAGEGFVHPQFCFRRILGGVAPADETCGVSGGDVGDRERAVLDGIGDSALEGASPNCGIVVGAALIVTLKPGGDFCEPVEVGAGVDVAAEIGEEKTVGLFFFGDGVVLVPEFEKTIVEGAPIGGRA